MEQGCTSCCTAAYVTKFDASSGGATLLGGTSNLSITFGNQVPGVGSIASTNISVNGQSLNVFVDLVSELTCDEIKDIGFGGTLALGPEYTGTKESFITRIATLTGGSKVFSFVLG